MMDGRVKTLHPKVHGGILARRHRPDDLAALAAHGIRPIDLVVVNLYPFAEAAREAGRCRSTIWSRRSTSAVRAWCARPPRTFATCSSSSTRRLRRGARGAASAERARSLAFRFDLARRAFAHTAAYDQMIATTLDDVRVDEAAASSRAAPARRSELCPTVWQPRLTKIRDLRYGENPHQPGAWYADESPRGFGGATVHQGKELSFTNLLDLDAAARIALEFDEPAAVVIKHTNPCGVATGARVGRGLRPRARGRCAVGVRRHRRAQPADRRRDRARARRRRSSRRWSRRAWPTPTACCRFSATKTNLRVVTASFARPRATARDARSILGAWLVQARDRVTEAARDVARPMTPRGRHAARADRRRSGRRCDSPGASART